MKYLIIGAGGTGGVTGYYMKKAGKDVTLIARGEHLKTIQEQGLTLEKMWDKTEETITIPATDMEHYTDHPDVIFVCVKGYSLDETIPFIKQIAKKTTIVIPVLNIYGTGGKMQKQLPELLVTDGCIYVSANIKEPGRLLQHGQILRIVFGVRDKAESRPELKEIQKDFCDSHIDGILSENIRRETLEKFSYVSPIGAAGLYYQRHSRRLSERRRSQRTLQNHDKRNHRTRRSHGSPIPERHGRCKFKNSLQPSTGSNHIHAERYHGRKTVRNRRISL